MKLFIVDDDPIWTKILSKTLLNKGHNDVESFSNGQDCLSNLHKVPVAVFLDYQMENEDGLSILKKIKAVNESIHVFFCTSHEDLGVAMHAIENGSSDFLLKTNLNEGELDQLLAQIK